MPTGQTTTYSFDLLNRLTTVAKPDNTTVSYSYDANGNKLTMVDGRGTTIYTYNAIGALTSVATPAGESYALYGGRVRGRSSSWRSSRLFGHFTRQSPDR